MGETPLGLIPEPPNRLPHPANGMMARVHVGDGAVVSIIDPTNNGQMEWVLRYGDAESIRFTVASVLSSYDDLLSGGISTTEAMRRLRIIRTARKALTNDR